MCNLSKSMPAMRAQAFINFVLWDIGTQNRLAIWSVESILHVCVQTLEFRYWACRCSCNQQLYSFLAGRYCTASICLLHCCSVSSCTTAYRTLVLEILLKFMLLLSNWHCEFEVAKISLNIQIEISWVMFLIFFKKI